MQEKSASGGGGDENFSATGKSCGKLVDFQAGNPYAGREKRTDAKGAERAMTYGAKIRQSREQKGMTQEELAEKLGVSRQAVSKWEGDLSQPAAAKLAALAALLDLPPETWAELDAAALKEKKALEQSACEAKALHRLKRWKMASAALAGLLCVSLLGNLDGVFQSGRAQEPEEADVSAVFPETVPLECRRSYEIGCGAPQADAYILAACQAWQEQTHPDEDDFWNMIFQREDGTVAVYLQTVELDASFHTCGMAEGDTFVFYAVPDETEDELDWKPLRCLGGQFYYGDAITPETKPFTNVLGRSGFKITRNLDEVTVAKLYVTLGSDGVPCVLTSQESLGKAVELDVDEDGDLEIVFDRGGAWEIHDVRKGEEGGFLYTLDYGDGGIESLSFDPVRGFVAMDTRQEILVRYILRDGQLVRQAVTDVTTADYPDVMGTELVFDRDVLGELSCGAPDEMIESQSVRITPRQQAYLALQLLYDLTGQRFDRLYCAVSYDGDARFSQLEGGLTDRVFFSSDMPERYGGLYIPHVRFVWQETGHAWSPLSFQALTEREDWQDVDSKDSVAWYYERMPLIQTGEPLCEGLGEYWTQDLWVDNGYVYKAEMTETEWGMAMGGIIGPYTDEWIPEDVQDLLDGPVEVPELTIGKFGFPVGWFEDDEGAELRIRERKDGTYTVDMRVYKRTYLEGMPGTYDPATGVLSFFGTDEFGNYLAAEVTTDGKGLTATLTASPFTPDRAVGTRIPYTPVVREFGTRVICEPVE